MKPPPPPKPTFKNKASLVWPILHCIWNCEFQGTLPSHENTCSQNTFNYYIIFIGYLNLKWTGQGEVSPFVGIDDRVWVETCLNSQYQTASWGHVRLAEAQVGLTSCSPDRLFLSRPCVQQLLTEACVACSQCVHALLDYNTRVL